MSDNTLSSPGKKVLAYFHEILQPVSTDLRVFRGQPLRGGFGTEMAVHLHEKWEIFGTAGSHSKGAPRFIRSGNAL
jgi:hypothetical protein